MKKQLLLSTLLFLLCLCFLITPIVAEDDDDFYDWDDEYYEDEYEDEYDEPYETEGFLGYFVIENNVVYWLNDDTAFVSTILPETETLHIPDTIEGKPVTLANSISFTTTAKEIVIDKNVKGVCRVSFIDCLKLEKITIFANIHYDVRDTESGMYYDYIHFANCPKLQTFRLLGTSTKDLDIEQILCPNLTDVFISDDVRSQILIDDVVFEENSTGLSLLHYPKNKSETIYHVPKEVTEVAFLAFENNTALETLVLNENISEFSLGKNQLKSIEIHKNNPFLKVVNKGVYLDSELIAFPGHPENHSLTLTPNTSKIGDLDAPNLKSLFLPEGMSLSPTYNYLYAPNLTLISLPSTLINLDILFSFRDHSLKSITLSQDNPLFTISNGGIYSKDKSILYYALPTQEKSFRIDEQTKSIDDNKVFIHSPQIKSLHISANIEDFDIFILNYLPNLEQILVASGNPYFTSVDGVLFTKDKKSLLAFPKAKGDYYSVPHGTQTIGNNAFSYNSLLVKVDFPYTLTAINSYAFEENYNLQTIILPPGLTSLGKGAFFLCYNLEKVVIPPRVATIEDDTFSTFDSFGYTNDYLFPNFLTREENSLPTLKVWLPSSSVTIDKAAFKGPREVVYIFPEDEFPPDKSPDLFSKYAIVFDKAGVLDQIPVYSSIDSIAPIATLPTGTLVEFDYDSYKNKVYAFLGDTSFYIDKNFLYTDPYDEFLERDSMSFLPKQIANKNFSLYTLPTSMGDKNSYPPSTALTFLKQIGPWVYVKLEETEVLGYITLNEFIDAFDCFNENSYYFNTDTIDFMVNIYAYPNFDAPIINRVLTGEHAYIYRLSQNGWCSLSRGGYVHTKNLLIPTYEE